MLISGLYYRIKWTPFNGEIYTYSSNYYHSIGFNLRMYNCRERPEMNLKDYLKEKDENKTDLKRSAEQNNLIYTL